MINGIKPQVGTKTIVDNKDDYSTALQKMIDRIDEQYGEYYKKTLTNLSYSPITINKGRRFDKLVQDNSVYCFVEKSTGDVYKSATWKQPYTKDFILTALKSMNKQGLISDVRDEIMSKLWVLSENYTYNKY